MVITGHVSSWVDTYLVINLPPAEAHMSVFLSNTASIFWFFFAQENMLDWVAPKISFSPKETPTLMSTYCIPRIRWRQYWEMPVSPSSLEVSSSFLVREKSEGALHCMHCTTVAVSARTNTLFEALSPVRSLARSLARSPPTFSRILPIAPASLPFPTSPPKSKHTNCLKRCQSLTGKNTKRKTDREAEQSPWPYANDIWPKTFVKSLSALYQNTVKSAKYFRGLGKASSWITFQISRVSYPSSVLLYTLLPPLTTHFFSESLFSLGPWKWSVCISEQFVHVTGARKTGHMNDPFGEIRSSFEWSFMKVQPSSIKIFFSCMYSSFSKWSRFLRNPFKTSSILEGGGFLCIRPTK